MTAPRAEVTEIALLGPFRLTPSSHMEPPLSRKAVGLLAYVASAAPNPVGREKLTDLLWGGQDETRARGSFRQALSQLRRRLGDDVLVASTGTIALRPGGAQCDVQRFTALIRDGSLPALAAAMEIYRGNLISDIEGATAEAFDDWLQSERARLEDQALDVLVRLANAQLAAGHPDAALVAAKRAIAINPLREDAHRAVLRSLAGLGRKAEALRHYGELDHLLGRELGVAPDESTRALLVDMRRLPAETDATTELDRHAAPAPHSQVQAIIDRPAISGDAAVRADGASACAPEAATAEFVAAAVAPTADGKLPADPAGAVTPLDWSARFRRAHERVGLELSRSRRQTVVLAAEKHTATDDPRLSSAAHGPDRRVPPNLRMVEAED